MFLKDAGGGVGGRTENDKPTSLLSIIRYGTSQCSLTMSLSDVVVGILINRLNQQEIITEEIRSYLTQNYHFDLIKWCKS